MFRVARTKAGVADFALYDLKGEGATDRLRFNPCHAPHCRMV